MPKKSATEVKIDFLVKEINETIKQIEEDMEKLEEKVIEQIQIALENPLSNMK